MMGIRSIAVLLVVGVASCGTHPQAREPATAAAVLAAQATLDGTAAVRGTAIDASTGEPVAGARIEGLNAEPVTTDENGQFELRGLAPGTGGKLVATTEAGWTGENRIRPLNRGDLEVVIYLRPVR